MTGRLTVTEYGRAALEALATEVARAKRADPLAPVTIVAPTTMAGILARRHLAAGVGGRRGVAGLTVTTLDRLAEQVAAPLLSPSRPATTPVVAAAWRAALTRDPGLFAPVAEHPATIRALVAAHRELRDLDAEPADGGRASPLDAVAATGPMAGDLVRLHRQVRDAVRRRCYDRTDLLLTAAGALGERDGRDRAGDGGVSGDGGVTGDGGVSGNGGVSVNGNVSVNDDGDGGDVNADGDGGGGSPPSRWRTEWGVVALYLPQDLTLAQSRFARAITGATEAVVIAGLTGVRRADAAVLRTLHRLGLAAPPNRGPAPPTATGVRHFSDSDAEVAGAVRQVVESLARTPAHRIAVLYATDAPYARALHEHLAAAGITVNGPGAVPVAERAIGRGLLAVLDLAGTDLPRADLFRALAEAPTLALDGTRVPLSRWERTSRLAGVAGGTDWSTRLDAYAATQHEAIDTEASSDDPSQGRMTAARRQVDAARGLQAFATRLGARLAVGEALTGWGDLACWALGLLHDLYGDDSDLARLPAAEQHAAAAVEQALSEFAGLAELEPATTLATVRETLAMALEQALPRVGRVGDGVFVGPLAAAVGLEADEVVVLGLAEDLYPGRAHPDPLLPDDVRDATGGTLPRSRDRLDARQRHLLAAMTAAPSVTACFPRGDLRRSTTRLPTRWLLPTLRALTEDSELAATDWDSATATAIVGEPSSAAGLLHARMPATEQQWRVRAVAAGIDVADGAIDRAVAMVRGRAADGFTRFDGNLTGADGLPDPGAGLRRISPTALESYAVCPHAYFVHRMLHVEPLEHPEQTITISPLDIGNLIHASMDELVRRCADDLPGYGEPWTDEHRTLLREIAADLADRYERRGATGHPRLWQQERRRILADLDAMLADDNAWRRDQDAAVVASELAFGKGAAAPVAIPLPGGGRVLMVGSADKVDRTRSGTLLVTDIKTGRSDGYRAISEQDPVVGGTRLQLPVYAHAARQLLGGADVRAQYWFVRRNRGDRVELPLTDTVETTYAQALATLVGGISAGLFPAKAPEADDFAWVQCPYCNPDGIGHRAVRRRWERKRSDPALAGLVALIDPGAAGGGDRETGADRDSGGGGETGADGETAGRDSPGGDGKPGGPRSLGGDP